MKLIHGNCGYEVTISPLENDVAIYIFCNHCNDIVGDGDLFLNTVENSTQIKNYNEIGRITIEKI